MTSNSEWFSWGLWRRCGNSPTLAARGKATGKAAGINGDAADQDDFPVEPDDSAGERRFEGDGGQGGMDSGEMAAQSRHEQKQGF